MDEKTPHSRTVSLSLCGIIIFKTKADTKPIKAMKPSNKVKNAFSKLGIPGKGSKASPEQDESGPSHLTSSAPEDPCADSPKQFKVEAVLHKVFKVKVPESMIFNDKHIGELCFDGFGKEKADTQVSRTEGEIRWGNTSGLSTLEKLSEITATLDSLGDTVNTLKSTVDRQGSTIDQQGSTIDQQEAEIRQLHADNHQQEAEIRRLHVDNHRQDAEIQELKETSDLWIDTRNRFFAVYLRKFHYSRFLSQNQAKILEDGNEMAHFGEPVNDARLFTRRVRNDVDIYKELYGLPFETVLNIRDDTRTLRVLRDHATVRVEKGYTSPNKSQFLTAFESFIRAINDDNVYEEYRYHNRGAAFQAWHALDNLNPTVQEERDRYRNSVQKSKKH